VRHTIINKIPTYSHFHGGHGTLTYGYPWLSIGAIVALEYTIFSTSAVRVGNAYHCTPPKQVLEYGSGGSTIFFAHRAEHVTSIECDANWAPRTLEALEKHGLREKVTLHVCSNPGSEKLVASMEDGFFDLLLVDHSADETVLGRSAKRAFSRKPLALIGAKKLNTNGWMVVDNYSVHGMQDFDWTGWSVWIFDDMQYSGRGTLIARRNKSFHALRG